MPLHTEGWSPLSSRHPSCPEDLDGCPALRPEAGGLSDCLQANGPWLGRHSNSGLKFPSKGAFPELAWLLPGLPALPWPCTTELYNCIFIPGGS